MFQFLDKINNSKLVAGLAMLVLNIGSKYIELNISKSQGDYIKYAIGREVLIFTILFVGTHDIIISILMTAAFIILSNTIFNENSKYCVMPNKYKKLKNVLDTNNDNYISDEEINRAHDILHKANLQQNKINQINNSNFFNDNKNSSII